MSHNTNIVFFCNKLCLCFCFVPFLFRVLLGGSTASQYPSYLPRFGVPIRYHMVANGTWYVTVNNSRMTVVQTLLNKRQPSLI